MNTIAQTGQDMNTPVAKIKLNTHKGDTIVTLIPNTPNKIINTVCDCI